MFSIFPKKYTPEKVVARMYSLDLKSYSHRAEGQKKKQPVADVPCLREE